VARGRAFLSAALPQNFETLSPTPYEKSGRGEENLTVARGAFSSVSLRWGAILMSHLRGRASFQAPSNRGAGVGPLSGPKRNWHLFDETRRSAVTDHCGERCRRRSRCWTRSTDRRKKKGGGPLADSIANSARESWPKASCAIEFHVSQCLFLRCELLSPRRLFLLPLLVATVLHAGERSHQRS
jgi:hypothetical protein